MKKKILLSVLVLLSYALALPSMAKSKKITLMLDTYINPNHGPVVIAKLRGYFKAQGLNVDIKTPTEPSTPEKLLLADSVDLAISSQPNLIMDVAAGLPLIRSATLIATPLNTLSVLDTKKFRGLTDLKGKKIGIPVAGNDQAILGTMLKTHNVKFKDVEIVTVGWELSAALSSGKVDAIWGGLRNFQTNKFAIEDIKANVFYPEENGVPLYDELVFVANANSYDKATIIAFNKAIAQATTYIVNHPQESWKEFSSYSSETLSNELNKRTWNSTLTRFALRPAAVDLQRYDQYAKFLYDHKIINSLPKAQDYVPIL